MSRRDEFWNFVIEREAIRSVKAGGAEPPYTKDPKLRIYHFPNIDRSHDPTSIWYRNNLSTISDQNTLLTATIAFRIFSSITTGEMLKHILINFGWDSRQVLETLQDRRHLFSPNVATVRDKNLSITCRIMENFMSRSDIPMLMDTTMQGCTHALSKSSYLGPGLAYAICCDLRQTDWLYQCTDKHEWAQPTPAAVKGVATIIETDLNPNTMAGKAVTVRVMRDLHREAGQAWGWEIKEIQRAVSMFGMYADNDLQMRRYRWK